MLKVGDKLVTKPLFEIEEAGANVLEMVGGNVVTVQGVDDYLVSTDDGDFTVDPDDTGLSWKTFYTLQGEKA